MCKFCENLNHENKNKLVWNVRSVMAVDNVRELFQGEGNDFIDDFCYFSIDGILVNGNMKVGVSYHQELIKEGSGEKVVISPFSEIAQFNYCPMCGKKISKDIKEFTGDGYGIELEENE